MGLEGLSTPEFDYVNRRMVEFSVLLPCTFKNRILCSFESTDEQMGQQSKNVIKIITDRLRDLEKLIWKVGVHGVVG